MEIQAERKARDLTDFFIEWRETCAIDKCKCTDDVRYVHEMFDARFKLLTSAPRCSALGNGVVALSDISIDFEKIHAFHLVELYYYGQDTIKGRPFKDHLFESAATKNDAGRLNGYFLQTLRSVANDSFRKSVVQAGGRIKDEAGHELNPLDFLSAENCTSNADGASSYDPICELALKETFEEFYTRFDTMWRKLEKIERLALLCFVFDLPKSSPTILAATGLKKSAFYEKVNNQREKVREMAETMLSHGHKLDELMHVFRDNIGKIAYEFGSKDPDCLPAIAQIDGKYRVDGTAK